MNIYIQLKIITKSYSVLSFSNYMICDYCKGYRKSRERIMNIQNLNIS